jgi:hypothetical protein
MFGPVTISRRRRPRGPPPSETQIIRTAEDAVSSLNTLGIDACFIGSMACMLFGNIRKPNVLISDRIHPTQLTLAIF